MKKIIIMSLYLSGVATAAAVSGRSVSLPEETPSLVRQGRVRRRPRARTIFVGQGEISNQEERNEGRRERNEHQKVKLLHYQLLRPGQKELLMGAIAFDFDKKCFVDANAEYIEIGKRIGIGEKQVIEVAR